MTETKVSLLEQLRIDRSARSEPKGAGERTWQITAALSLVVAAGAAGVSLWPHAKGPVTVPAVAAPERSAESPAPAAAGSILDASGYIVAQRQATVSAKNAYKVREVLFQEGQSVKAGDILARMDDSNTLAALEEAKASLIQAEANREAARVSLADARPIFERNERQLKEQVMTPPRPPLTTRRPPMPHARRR